jgi:ribulose-5-phosphate 4-epimerase/fuculose-1-phosphate aldolase
MNTTGYPPYFRRQPVLLTGATSLINESATPPLPAAAGWTTAAPAAYTAAAAGSHKLYPWAKDAAGNVSAVFATPRTVVIDTTLPAVSAFTIPATSNSLTVSVTTFTATDNVGVTGFLITESSTTPLPGAVGWTTVKPASYIAAASGSHTLYPWAKDAAGNVSAVFASPGTVAIESTVPIVSAFTIPATSASLTVPVTTFTATDNVGVTGYLITESSTPPLSAATGWTTVKPASYIAAAAGSHTLYPWAKDAAGNVSAVFATPGTVVIDTTKPAVSAFAIPATSASLTVPVTTFTATDNVGVTGYLITESSTAPLPGAAGWTSSAPAAYTAAAVGSHKLYPWAKDAAGNVSAVFATPATVVIDTAKPAVSAFTIPATSNSLTVSVTTFTATDNIGVTGYLITESSTPPLPGDAGWTTVKPASYIAAAVGSHTLYPWAKDAAGNVSALFATPRTVVIDTTVPAVSGFTMPATLASLTVPVTTFTATDNIGVTGYLINESSTPPLPGATGWTTAAPASYTSAAVGSHTLYPWAKDAAGNVSALFATPQTVVIDTTKPAVSGFTMPATSASLTVPVTTFTATDNIGVTGYLITESSTLPLSGAAGWTTAASAAYTAAAAGSHKLYPWAKDAAGNVSAVFATPRTVVITLQ